MIKAIIEQNLTEDKFSVYNSVYDLKTLSDYYSKIPKTSTTKFVKFLKFSQGQTAIYNISDIMITPNVADGSEGKKKVQIVYSGDEAKKVWDIKKFASMCKKIFKALEDVDESEVEVEAVLEGQNKPTKFRFYYDSDNGFAILVHGTGTKGLEDFLNSYEGELRDVVSVPKVAKAKVERKARAPRDKKAAKKNSHEGYVCIDSSDSFGHRIKLWKRDPDYKANETEEIKEWNDNELFGDSEKDAVDEAEKKVSYAAITKDMTEAMKKVLVKHGIRGGDLYEVMRALDYGVFDDQNPEFCLKNELEHCEIQLVD